MSPRSSSFFFFFNDTATTEIYTLSLHDALPISQRRRSRSPNNIEHEGLARLDHFAIFRRRKIAKRSEEHTSELQSRQYLVCRLLLEKKSIDDHVWPEARPVLADAPRLLLATSVA